MAYFLFLLVNATLFIRPAEIIPGMEDMQPYQYLILPCLLLSLLRVAQQLNPDEVVASPITACVLGLLPAILMSHLSHGRVENAVEAGFDFAKVLVYYLLFVAVLNSPARLRSFTLWMLIFTGTVTLVAVLRYHGLIDLPTLTASIQDNRINPVTGEEIVIRRLRGTGLFGDPNEFCMLVVLGLPLTLYWMIDGEAGIARLLCVVPLGLFLYALGLTQSRGGLLAVMVGVLLLLRVRFGPLVAVSLVAGLLPVMLFAAAGRQADVFTSGDTAQERYQLWNEALEMLHEAPLFGIGTDEFRSRISLEVHNSFMHCFVELGFFGGMLFLGAFGFAVWTLYHLNPDRVTVLDPTVRRLQPYVLAVVGGFVTLILTLSRAYLVPTYMILGLTTAYLQFVVSVPPLPQRRFGGWLLQRFALASLGFLLVTFILVRTLVRWG